jgi:hypothetical protein
MQRNNRAARLGDLIAAVFDEAARYAKDPGELTRLATRAVWHLMRTQGPWGTLQPQAVRVSTPRL